MKDSRGRINALTNAKRAIDCQIDKVFKCYGIKSKYNNFPSKLELLKDIGMVSPSIIRKVITTRNYLEHEYIIPEIEKTEDAVDIATLFVDASERSLNPFIESFFLGNPSDSVDKNTTHTLDTQFRNGYVRIDFDSEKFIWTIYIYSKGSLIHQYNINNDEQEYLTLVKTSVYISKAKDITLLIPDLRKL